MKILRLLVVFLLVSIAGTPARGRNFEGRDVYLQVMTQSVPVRSGPGGSYQEIGRERIDFDDAAVAADVLNTLAHCDC